MLDKFKRIFFRNRSRGVCEESLNCYSKIIKDNSNVIIIDVRSPQEFEEGHINGAILIPEYEIFIKSKGMLLDKSQKIFLYCNTGVRSEKAKKILKKQGYSNVYNMCRKLDL